MRPSASACIYRGCCTRLLYYYASSSPSRSPSRRWPDQRLTPDRGTSTVATTSARPYLSYQLDYARLLTRQVDDWRHLAREDHDQAN